MRNKIITTLILICLFLAYWFVLGEQDYSTYRAKKRYKAHKELLLENWKTNNENITKLAILIDKTPYIRSLFILPNNEILLSVGSLMGTEETILINEFEELENDTTYDFNLNKYTFDFRGKMESDFLQFLLNNTHISFSQIHKLISFLNEANCSSFSHSSNNEVSIEFKGFQYVYTKNVRSMKNKLNQHFYWTFYENFMFCGPRHLIEN